MADLSVGLAASLRRYERGGHDRREYVDSVVSVVCRADPADLLVALPRWLSGQLISGGQRGGFLDLSEIVRVATAGYGVMAERDRGDAEPPASRESVWKLIDADFPQLRGSVVDEASALVDELSRGADSTFCYPVALDHLPDSPRFRAVVDRLEERFGADDLAARFELLRLRHDAGSFDTREIATAATLAVVEAAIESRASDIACAASEYLRQPLSPESVDLLAGIVSKTQGQPDFATVTCLIVVCGYSHADDLVSRLADVLDRTEWPEPGDGGGGPTSVVPGSLGRASAACHFAGVTAPANRLARLALAWGTDGWWHTGEVVLAAYVLTRGESDAAERRRILRLGVEAARHGNVHPLFARLYVDAVHDAVAAGEIEIARMYLGYARVLHGTRGRTEGHFWNPLPIVPFARRVPFDPDELTADVTAMLGRRPSTRYARPGP